MMTRKDYQRIADALRYSVQKTANPMVQGLLEDQHRKDVMAVSEALKGTNPNYNQQKFVNACGYNFPAR